MLRNSKFYLPLQLFGYRVVRTDCQKYSFYSALPRTHLNVYQLMTIYNYFDFSIFNAGAGLRRGSAANRLLGLSVRIPSRLMDVCLL